MPQNNAEKQELVLAQNQHAFIQDETKGLVKVHVGPITITPSGNDRPVRYNAGKRQFETVNLQDAIQQNPVASEGSYIVLENPSKASDQPSPGQSSAPAELQTGRKVNIQGPTTFALWPGQVATVVEGHQLKSNEYVRARVYNVEEAKKNWKQTGLPDLPVKLVTGQVIIIKGNEISFFIPPTGVEVLPDPILRNQFVSQAVTLERLEYCLLLDENGNKRYERGPAVVFPKATEQFVAKQQDSALAAESGIGEQKKTVKLKAIELNDQMGLYIKVIADYVDMDDVVRTTSKAKNAVDESAKDNEALVDGVVYRQHKAGEELFITGAKQRIYYPRAEHAIIEYGSEDGKFKRQRYYAIAIPKGEARYVLDKNTGIVAMVKGPTVFLPDPRHQVIVRRVLDGKTVKLWYPGNEEAVAYNESLRSLAETSLNYVSDTSYSAAMDMSRSINRMTNATSALADSRGGAGASLGDRVLRGTKFTPPPSLTLNTKYDGPPTVEPYTGYAVQIVDKSGTRRIVKGPTTILLEYDETLEKLSLSTGNPKSTDNLFNAVYLRVDNNKVSDTIEVETKDMVIARIKVSYRVNFEDDPNKWFSVENYVKFLTDHCRSLVRASVKHRSIKDLIDNSSQIVRDVILGDQAGEKKTRPGRKFDENNMRIYDVEILKTDIVDSTVASLIIQNQKQAVQQTLDLTSRQALLESTKTLESISQEMTKLTAATALNALDYERKLIKARHEAQVASGKEAAIRSEQDASLELSEAQAETKIKNEEFTRLQSLNVIDIARLEKETDLFVKRMAAVDPKLALAIDQMAKSGALAHLTAAVAPLAIAEQQGVGTILKRLFSGTQFAETVSELALTDENK